MSTLEIEISDEMAAKLNAAAERLGVTPANYLRRIAEEKLSETDEGFERAADYVLTKNAELYRRLA